jgi:hypothetical protein
MKKHNHFQRFYSPAAIREIPSKILDEDKELMFDHDSLRILAVRLICRLEFSTHNIHKGIPFQLDRFCENKCSSQFQGTTLVVTDNVEKFYYSDISPLIAQVPDIKRLVKKRDQVNAKKKVLYSNTELLKEGKRGETKQKLVFNDPKCISESIEDATLNWPLNAIVNSKQHLKELAESFPSSALRSMFAIPEHITDESHTALVESLLCGCVLMNTEEWSDRIYENYAFTAADSKKLTYVVASLQILYGTNLAIDRVILLSDGVLDAASYKQLCGRVGRTGKSDVAEIIFKSSDVAKCAVDWRLRMNPILDDAFESLYKCG